MGIFAVQHFIFYVRDPVHGIVSKDHLLLLCSTLVRSTMQLFCDTYSTLLCFIR